MRAEPRKASAPRLGSDTAPAITAEPSSLGWASSNCACRRTATAASELFERYQRSEQALVAKSAGERENCHQAEAASRAGHGLGSAPVTVLSASVAFVALSAGRICVWMAVASPTTLGFARPKSAA
jgi:hypothetical protein